MSNFRVFVSSLSVVVLLVAGYVALATTQTVSNQGSSARLRVRRYSSVHDLTLPPQFSRSSAHADPFSFAALVAFISDKLQDSNVSKIVSMNGRPLTTVGDVLSEEEVIGLASNQHFFWPFVERGHVHRLQGLEMDRLDKIRITSLSDKPRVLLVENLIELDEAEQIVGIASPHMKQSTLVLHKHEKPEDHSKTRTSTGHFVKNSEHSVIKRIAQRVANLTRTHPDWAEDMQVIHYEPWQHYHAHYDFIEHVYDVVASRHPWDNRYVTVLFYLSDVTRGGGTVFPKSNPQYSPLVHGYGDKVCAEDFEAVRPQPKRGNAVIFYNMDEAEHPYGKKDDWSLHGGCDPLEGEKWAANFWVHNYYWHNSPPEPYPQNPDHDARAAAQATSFVEQREPMADVPPPRPRHAEQAYVPGNDQAVG